MIPLYNPLKSPWALVHKTNYDLYVPLNNDFDSGRSFTWASGREPGWESIPGLLERSTNMGSALLLYVLYLPQRL
jgi:hypothetical protein